jgi:hypothetical protein
MCFSASASFAAAAFTAAIGFATLRQIRSLRELPLASMPLLFAFQQAIEGELWLQLTDGSSSELASALSFSFLVFAKVLWPAYTAFVVLLIEPDPRRRQALYTIALFGCSISIYVLHNLIGSPPAAAICGHSIAYGGDESVLSWQGLIYLLCTCVPLLLSSSRNIQIFGSVILVGFAVSAYAYFRTFISVWCFFAAADSSFLYFYFKRGAAARVSALRH